MISYMKRNLFFLGMVVLASVCVTRVCAAVPDKVLLLQDENFFLHDQIKKLQAELIDKDNALKKVLLERETARYDLDGVTKAKEALEDKVSSLYRMVKACKESVPRETELALMPCRAQRDDAVKQLKVMDITLAEKNARMAELTQTVQDLQQKVDMFTGEKLSLVNSVKKIAAEYDALKDQTEGQIADARAEADAKVRDFQVRLTAEQTLVQEKIAQAKKPLEDKIAGMEAACVVREQQVSQKEKLAQALLQENVRKLEQQIALLRENAGLEVKKIQDAAAQEVKKWKDELGVCRQAPGK